MTALAPAENRPHSAARRHAAGLSLIITASVLWSLSGLAVKLAGMHPVTFTCYRSICAAIPMALLMGLSSGRRPPVRWMALSAGIYTGVVGLLVAAMTWDTAAMGILLQYTAPAFCALFAWLFQRRSISRRTALAMAIAAAGMAVMIGSRGMGSSLVGPACGLASGVAFGAIILVLPQIDRAAGGKANPFQIVLFNNAGAAALLLPLCLVLGATAATPTQLLIVGATGIIQLAFPYVLFQFGLRRVSPVEASLLLLLEPVLNPIWVALVVRERPDWGTVVGGIAILIAMTIEAIRPPAESSEAAGASA